VQQKDGSLLRQLNCSGQGVSWNGKMSTPPDKKIGHFGNNFYSLTGEVQYTRAQVHGKTRTDHCRCVLQFNRVQPLKFKHHDEIHFSPSR